jgi:hypothetical protein
MIPVVQSRTGEDGTCFRACVASILEVPEGAVPDFGASGDDDAWWQDIQDWLGKAGYSYRRAPVSGARPVGWSTIEGISPRGGMHACVAKDGELVHDPHPRDGTGRGLVEPRYYGLFEKTGHAKDGANAEVIYGPFSTEQQAKAELTKLRRSKAYKNFDMTYVRERFTKPTQAQESAGYELGDPRLSQGFFVFGARKRATDQAGTMAQLRKKAMREGPFFIQETIKSGEERTIPVRELAKGADSKTLEVLALLALVRAWYEARKEQAQPDTYDLAAYRPKRRSFDGLQLNRYKMHELLDALGIDIKEYMRRTEQQKENLLRTAIERLDQKYR